MKVKEIDLLDIANGAIREKLAEIMAEVYANLIDESASAKKARKININLSFTPIDARRKQFRVETTTSVALAPSDPIATSIAFEQTEDGGLLAIELGGQERGQLDLSGKEIEEKVIPIFRAVP